jgi:secreted trypsin-like serine protease
MFSSPGDSGSGFYFNTGRSWTINGIVSSAISEECVENQFVLFTNVPKFVDWIKGKMKEFSNDDGWVLKPLKCSFSLHKTMK